MVTVNWDPREQVTTDPGKALGEREECQGMHQPMPSGMGERSEKCRMRCEK